MVRAGRRQLARAAGALALAVGLALGLPAWWISDFHRGERLRTTQQHVLEPVASSTVHHGKHSRVDVYVTAATGRAKVHADFDVDHPPRVGEQLLVVIDPDHPTYALLAEDDTTFSQALVEAAGLASLFVAGVLFVGWGPQFPPVPALRAVRLRTGSPPAVDAVVRGARVGRPRSLAYRWTHGSKEHTFYELDLEVPGTGSLLSGSFLAHGRVHPGADVVLVGDVRVGGWCALQDGSTVWSVTPLVPTPDRPAEVLLRCGCPQGCHPADRGRWCGCTRHGQPA